MVYKPRVEMISNKAHKMKAVLPILSQSWYKTNWKTKQNKMTLQHFSMLSFDLAKSVAVQRI